MLLTEDVTPAAQAMWDTRDGGDGLLTGPKQGAMVARPM